MFVYAIHVGFIINFSGFCPWLLIFFTISALKDGPIENEI